MKVCTDSCLFGAWTVDYFLNNNIETKHVLDIGAGTGLLSLMLAQKLKTPVDAVEIEREDFLQCRDNFEQSAWSGLLQTFWSDIKKFQSAKKYHLIISNPPFFENDLKPADKNKLRAKHGHSLSLKELFAETARLLCDEGYFALLLPFHRREECLTTSAELGFHPTAVCNVRQTPVHEPFRLMLLFQQKTVTAVETEITIKGENGLYTERFTELLKDYYLHL
jgi:tRNA1Val (adenine37-N6)-methyltransferase